MTAAGITPEAPVTRWLACYGFFGPETRTWIEAGKEPRPGKFGIHLSMTRRAMVGKPALL